MGAYCWRSSEEPLFCNCLRAGCQPVTVQSYLVDDGHGRVSQAQDAICRLVVDLARLLRLAAKHHPHRVAAVPQVQRIAEQHP